MRIRARAFRIGLVALLLWGLPHRPAAQKVTFDVASIKENKEPGSGGTLRRTPDGGVRTQHFRARSLITVAYRLQPFQLVGAPGWTNDTYYDVDARPAGVGQPDEMFERLQGLLTDRFRLAFHRESRQIDGFALLQSRPGTLGPSMKSSALDCDSAPGERQCREGGITANSFKAFGASMWSLQQVLISEIGAPVADESGLSGTYDLELRWTKEPTPADDLPSIFTALHEQLGLRLDRRRVSTEVFVVDRFERPTPD
jgi:uncharacterized protein (TIGR03435 family)